MSAPGFDWYPLLEPGEGILWQGRPRDGVGWRCALNEAPVQMLLVAALAASIAAVIVGTGGGAAAVTVATAAIVCPIPVVMELRREGRTLAAIRYVVTDRRSMSVDHRDLTVLVVDHNVARPRRRDTVCGTAIDLGPARRFVVAGGDPPGWRAAIGNNLRPKLSFRALEPAEAPFDMLAALAREANPLGLGAVPTIAADWVRDPRPQTVLPAANRPTYTGRPGPSVPGLIDPTPSPKDP